MVKMLTLNGNSNGTETADKHLLYFSAHELQKVLRLTPSEIEYLATVFRCVESVNGFNEFLWIHVKKLI